MPHNFTKNYGTIVGSRVSEVTVMEKTKSLALAKSKSLFFLCCLYKLTYLREYNSTVFGGSKNSETVMLLIENSLNCCSLMQFSEIISQTSYSLLECNTMCCYPNAVKCLIVI